MSRIFHFVFSILAFWLSIWFLSASSRLICTNSRLTNSTASTAATKSAMGAEYMTPSIPKKIGRIRISGSRKIICRVSERKTPLTALPIDVKKLAVIGWIQFRNVKKRKIRKYCSAKRKYSSDPLPKNPMIWRGKIWKLKKEHIDIRSADVSAFLYVSLTRL